MPGGLSAYSYRNGNVLETNPPTRIPEISQSAISCKVRCTLATARKSLNLNENCSSPSSMSSAAIRPGMYNGGTLWAHDLTRPSTACARHVACHDLGASASSFDLWADLRQLRRDSAPCPHHVPTIHPQHRSLSAPRSSRLLWPL